MLTSFLLLLIFFQNVSFISSQSPVIPSSFSFSGAESVNGSSYPRQHCSNDSGVITCTDPTSSVLFDGHIPTLTGLDGDMWASQLLTLRNRVSSGTNITFNFSATADHAVAGVQVTMFNCPKWGIGVQTIELLGLKVTVSPPNSCESLLNVCISVESDAGRMQSYSLHLTSSSGSDWMYLAEVTFYASSTFTCPAAVTEITTTSIRTAIPNTPVTSTPKPTTTSSITTASTRTPAQILTTSTTRTSTLQPAATGTGESLPTTSTKEYPSSSTSPSTLTQSEVCPACSTSVALASALSAITTALLATVIFVLVQITVCKCRPKFTPAGAETGTPLAREGEGQEYEQADERGVTTSDPTYMEVEEVTETVFELQQNVAYATTN